MADLGYREGYAQLGSYRSGDGLGFVYAPWGGRHAPAAGTMWAWITAEPATTNVVMITAYAPSFVNGFPTRAAVRGGEACAFPSIEAEALVAAGVAAYA